MLPAGERLDPDHPAGLGFGLGLVVKNDLSVLDGAPQLSEQLHLLAAVPVALRCVQLTAPAGGLRLAQRHIRALEELVRGRRVIRVESDPDAGFHVHADPVDEERALQRLAQPRGDDQSLLWRLEVLEQNAELVAPAPREHVRAAGGGPEARTDLPDERVTRLVAEGLVDLLEPVESDYQQGQRNGRLDRLQELLVQEAASRKIGQLVGHGEPAQLREGLNLPERDGGADHRRDHGGRGQHQCEDRKVGDVPVHEQRERADREQEREEQGPPAFDTDGLDRGRDLPGRVREQDHPAGPGGVEGRPDHVAVGRDAVQVHRVRHGHREETRPDQ